MPMLQERKHPRCRLLTSIDVMCSTENAMLPICWPDNWAFPDMCWLDNWCNADKSDFTAVTFIKDELSNSCIQTKKQNKIQCMQNVVKRWKTEEKSMTTPQKNNNNIMFASWPENLKKRVYGSHCTVQMYLLRVLKQKPILPVGNLLHHFRGVRTSDNTDSTRIS
jgi:hypothetical protein